MTTYKEFEAAVAKMLNSTEKISIKIPYGKGHMELAEAKITYKDGKIHASWMDEGKDDCWGITADFFAAGDGRLKVRWYDTYSFKLNLAS